MNLTQPTTNQEFRRLTKTLRPNEAIETTNGVIIRNSGRAVCRIIIMTPVPKPDQTPT